FNYFLMPGPGSEWSKMPDDLVSIVKYLKKKKGISPARIGLIGASLGANICLIYASRNKSIPLTVLLSPGWEYAGLTSGEAAKVYGRRPLLIASSPLDKYSYESSGVIFDMAKKGRASTTFLPGKNAQHGVQMFDGKFEIKLINWIKEKVR
ncbi:MAG: acyl-CoA thioester hydrolase/BAAT C-terminal domain-containing protein, partial [Elusimicrobiota bacterium]